MVSFVQAQNDIEKLYNRCLVLKLITFLQLNLKVTYRLSHYKQLILFTRPGLFNKIPSLDYQYVAVRGLL